jgi:hypothetical protein
VLVEALKVQLVWPPVAVRARAGSAGERAFAFACHGFLLFVFFAFADRNAGSGRENRSVSRGRLQRRLND